MEVTTFTKGHDFNVGDIVIISNGDKWKRIRELLVRPRVDVIAAVTATTLTLESRRMTWKEWRTIIWTEVKR